MVVGKEVVSSEPQVASCLGPDFFEPQGASLRARSASPPQKLRKQVSHGDTEAQREESENQATPDSHPSPASCELSRPLLL